MAKANRRNAARNGRAQKTGGQSRRARGSSSTAIGNKMSRVGVSAAQLTRSANATRRRLERTVTGAVEDNPLVVGAALFVAGAALGYAMRGLLRDSMWLEEQREAVMDKAKELARTASDKVGSLRPNRSGEPTEAH